MRYFLLFAFLAAFFQSLAQNVGISDVTISPANLLQIHKSTTDSAVLLQLSNSETGMTSSDGVLMGLDGDTSFYIRNNEGTGRDIKLGSGMHNTTIESDGTLKFEGNATVWDDIMVFPDGTSRGSSNPPVWTLFKNNSGSQGVWLFFFSNSSEQEVYFTLQIPHSYKVESTIYPHVHWTTTSGTPTRTNVVWGLEYTVMAIGGTFPSTSTLLGNSVISGISTITGTGQHLITSLGTISGTGLGISTVLVCRLFRKVGDDNDTFGYPTGLLGVDFHFEKDTEGSRLEFIK